LKASLTCRLVGTYATVVAAGSLLALAAEPSAAQTKLPYGTRAGMTVTVLAVEGLDTEHAVIRVKHTREDAEDFCRSYMDAPTLECASRTLVAEAKLADRVTANCKSGEFTNVNGDRYRFEGLPDYSKETKEMADLREAIERRGVRPKYIVRHLSDDEIADGSVASGYVMNMIVFRALCPATAPADD
jgi:hypothetical protein